MTDLTNAQKKLLGQYWNYDETSEQTLEELINGRIADYLNNAMIEQTNRNALASVEQPPLIDTGDTDGPQ